MSKKAKTKQNKKQTHKKQKTLENSNFTFIHLFQVTLKSSHLTHQASYLKIKADAVLWIVKMYSWLSLESTQYGIKNIA